MTRQEIIHIIKELKKIGFNPAQFEKNYKLAPRCINRIFVAEWVSEDQINKIYAALQKYKKDVEKIIDKK
jgi:hypothetical protein